jgi:hypothetical protein
LSCVGQEMSRFPTERLPVGVLQRGCASGLERGVVPSGPPETGPRVYPTVTPIWGVGAPRGASRVTPKDPQSHGVCRRYRQAL